MEKLIPWWVIQIVLALVALFFILFGVNLLYMAYQVNDPFKFIMTFFSSNLIILIGAALFIGFILKIFRGINKKTEEKEEEPARE
jgi:TRAP-type C4-dicarboxylate transport system permease small subunit